MTFTRRLYLSGSLVFGGLIIAAVFSGFNLWAIPIIVGLFAIFVAGIFVSRIVTRKVNSKEMMEVSDDIHNAARVYLRRQIRTILLAVPFMAAVVWAFMGWREALAFTLGVCTSITAGYLGMSISVRTNIQTADLAENSFSSAFRMAVYGGGVMGLLVTGLSLLVLTVLFLIFKDPRVLVGFGVGGSLAALFGQIGGGIFTKSADVGADLVGKVEEKIPEDDPRNAAVIADLVGDNVGDCAGRGADLFQTFSDDIITGSVVCATLVSIYGSQVIYLPILLQCVGIISSIIGILATRQWSSDQKPTSIFNVGLWISAVLSSGGAIALSYWLIDDITIGLAAILGVATMLITAATTRHFAGINKGPVNKIAAASHRGAALTLMTGTAFGLRSPIISMLTIIAAIMLAFRVAGGTILAILAVNIGTDLLIGIIMASDAFGPIVDNAAGIAKIGKAKRKVFESLSHLDTVGNTLKATTKSYAMASGTVTAFVLFATFFTITGNTVLDLITPYSLGFIFVGISLPYLMSSVVIGATAKTAELMVDEVRDQFRLNPAIIAGKAKPNYTHCVDIATKNALHEMLLPGGIAFLLPITIGFLFGSAALGALLIGAVSSSALLGAFFNNTGTAFDNAKKTIEEDPSLEGSLAHASAVVGDTYGDPLKDVAGPSLLIFMKLIGMTSLLIAPILNTVTVIFK
ncbi:MAG: sodium-translocating pyrophosphatase [Chloroflexi bacterium]|nr:sodium-translocating pyrophosphatase [Chloroflexota bacterium]